MAYPEPWIRSALEDECECSAYPVDAPEGAQPPYSTFVREGTTREAAAVAVSGEFRITIYADSYLEAKQLADAARAGLHNFSGQAGETTIDGAWIVDEVDGQPVYLDGRDKATYSVEQVLRVFWQE